MWYNFGELVASRSLKIASLFLPFNKAILSTLITAVFFSSSGDIQSFQRDFVNDCLKESIDRYIYKPRYKTPGYKTPDISPRI